MGNTVTVVKGDVTEVFDNVIGHQIGNGAIQVLLREGGQRVINNFDDVTVELDEEAAAQFAFDLQAMEAGAAAKAEAVEEAAANDEGEYPENQEDEPTVQ